MSKIINIHTGMERKIQTFNCSICDDKFSENEPGLKKGIIGNTIVSLCPTCFSGMFTLVNYLNQQIKVEE